MLFSGYPTGASVDPNQQKQLAPPVIDQQAPQAVPQATCQVSQAVPQVPQTMPQGSQSVPQIQYPAQYISQEVVQDQKATPMISNVPVHSASNGSVRDFSLKATEGPQSCWNNISDVWVVYKASLVA